jgi:transcriptional regulator of arginine metabolism
VKQKTERLLAIREVILENKVSNQDVLLKLVQGKGFDLTQATLSRDLKQLKVAKVPLPEGDYVYTIPGVKNISDEAGNRFMAQGWLSIEFSGNMAVIKTKPGFANGIASIIDLRGPFEILGTIAGDDTILGILKEGFSKSSVMTVFSLLFPGINN